MNTTASADQISKTRSRREWLVGGFAVGVQLLLAAMHKQWLYKHVQSGPYFAWIILLCGCGLLVCALRKSQVQKKLLPYLGRSFDNDFLGEVIALRALNDANAWMCFESRSRWEIAGVFFYSSILGFIAATFVS